MYARAALVAVLALAVAGAASAQSCRFVNGTGCGLAETQVFFYRFSDPVEGFLANSTICSKLTTATTCNAEGAKGCTYQGGQCRHKEALACGDGATGPICNFSAEVIKFCNGLTDKAACTAKRGCEYTTGVCLPDDKENVYITWATAAKLNVQVGINALKVDDQCKAIKDEASCTKAAINSASSVARTGAVLMAVVVLAASMLLL